MKLSSILEIIGGKLNNTPSISHLVSYQSIACKVKNGDLFFSIDDNTQDIQLAISKGAFGVVSRNNLKILDDEIAWIQVDDVWHSILKLARFLMCQKDVDVYYCDNISFELLKLLSTNYHKDIIQIKNNNNILNKIIKLQDKNYIICQNKKIAFMLSSVAKEIIYDKDKLSNIISHTLFEISFKYDNQVFNKIRLPVLYIDEFLSIFIFLKRLNYNIDLTKLRDFKYFSPIFIDNKLQQIKFGSSSKFILIQNNKQIAKKQKSFLKQNYKYGKFIDIVFDGNLDSLRKRLMKIDYNCAYIEDITKEQLDKLITIKQTQILFDW